jgi:hypothetical protein
MGRFIQIMEVVHIFGPHFSAVKSCVFIYKINGLGYILGDFFFASSSGHPASRQSVAKIAPKPSFNNWSQCRGMAAAVIRLENWRRWVRISRDIGRKSFRHDSCFSRIEK